MAGGTFPTSIPSYSATSGGETANTAGAGTGLSGLLNNFETDVTALSTKIGTGSSTPTSNTVLTGNGVGTSVWGSSLTNFTLVTPTIASFVNATHDHTNAAGGGTLGTNSVPTAAIQSDAVTDAKMIYGKLRSRQGGSASDWSSAGTTTFDYSGTNVFMQLGTILSNASPKTITFPTAFNQVPHVQATVASVVGTSCFVLLTGVNTTTVTIQVYDNAGTANAAQTVNWLAVGE